MRRPRYSGKYPKKPDEKYKELNPDAYQEDIAHIEAKGRTVLGTHKPIMVDEILQALKPLEGQKALDLTLGYGGHSMELLTLLGTSGQLVGMDQDAIELERTKERIQNLEDYNNNFTGIHSNFRSIKNVFSGPERVKFDMVLADLGLSSMQIDRPERGFSLKHNTKLDFRMDSSKGKSALDVLTDMDVEEFKNILVEFADEPFPHRMATNILESVKKGNISTTKDLKDVIVDTASKIKKYPTDPDKAVPRVFQAIRIYVNEELTALDELLADLPTILNSKARVAFLTFHSGEDRRVKKFFKLGLKEGHFSEIHGPIKAGGAEIMDNRRARSAKLRYGVFKN